MEDSRKRSNVRRDEPNRALVFKGESQLGIAFRRRFSEWGRRLKISIRAPGLRGLERENTEQMQNGSETGGRADLLLLSGAELSRWRFLQRGGDLDVKESF